MTLAKAAGSVKAALYMRASTGEQDASCDQQAAACNERPEQLGLTVLEVFRDDGISGARHDRPAYRQMLQAAEAKQFDTLVLWKQSRLGRDSVEVERAIRRLEFHGLRIVTCDGYDTSGTSLKNRKLIRGVKGLLDETYLDDLREDTLRGLGDQFERGYWTGGKPYGYDLAAVTSATETDAYGQPKRIGSKLQINADKAKFILEAFQRYANSESTLMIASDFNRRKVPSPGSYWKRKQRRNDKWLASTLSSNPKCGYGFLNNPCTSAGWNGSAVRGPRTRRVCAATQRVPTRTSSHAPRLSYASCPRNCGTACASGERGARWAGDRRSASALPALRSAVAEPARATGWARSLPAGCAVRI
jgi:DNA invertase Pin-like site-specific DNA recombinase